MACSVASIVLLIGVWQAIGNNFGILFAPFTATMARLWDILLDGTLLPALAISARLYCVTLFLSIVLGISGGLLLARIKWISSAFEPYVFLLYATPPIALVPFIAVTMGFGFAAQVVVALIVAIFPILLGVTQGARSIPPIHLDVAAMFGSSERQLWREVILPYVTPFAMSGIRQSIALSLAGTLVAEFFLNTDGLAEIFLQGATIVDTTLVLAVTVLVAVLALILGGIGEYIEARLVKWQDSDKS